MAGGEGPLQHSADGGALSKSVTLGLLIPPPEDGNGFFSRLFHMGQAEIIYKPIDLIQSRSHTDEKAGLDTCKA